MKIFLLEDDEVYQQILLEILQEDLSEMGNEVVLRECVDGAAEAILAGNFDLLIIDIVLPRDSERGGDECRDGGITVLEDIASICLPPTLLVSHVPDPKYWRRIDALNLLKFGFNADTYFQKDYFISKKFSATIKRIEQIVVAEIAESGCRPDAALRAQRQGLFLSVRPFGNSYKAKITGCGVMKAQLTLTSEELRDVIDQLRQTMREIVYFKAGTPPTRVYMSDIEISENMKQRTFEILAKAGSNLYQVLFYGNRRDNQSIAMGDRLREWSEKSNLEITIYSDDFFIPWSLLYVGDADNCDANADWDKFFGFKHIVAQIPLQQVNVVQDPTILGEKGLSIGINVHGNIDTEVGHPLVGNQLEYWDFIKSKNGTRVSIAVGSTRDDALERIQELESPHHLLYFFCHAKPESSDRPPKTYENMYLEFGKDEKLTVKELEKCLSKFGPLRANPLIFINACRSAQMTPLFYKGWMPSFTANGARGLIGTECNMPALFASVWARRFFDDFLCGDPVGKILLRQRRYFYLRHGNILGLLYALYCHSGTRLFPALQVK
ncbi:MAG: response regulator [Pseudomonadota bacterium]